MRFQELRDARLVIHENHSIYEWTRTQSRSDSTLPLGATLPIPRRFAAVREPRYSRCYLVVFAVWFGLVMSFAWETPASASYVEQSAVDTPSQSYQIPITNSEDGTTLASVLSFVSATLDTTAHDPSELLIATGRQQHGKRVTDSPRGRIPNNATSRERMARRLRTKSGRANYARRKAIVEPVFGQTKVRQRAGQFRLRGLEGAQGECTLHALCHNLRKLANASSPGVLTTVS